MKIFMLVSLILMSLSVFSKVYETNESVVIELESKVDNNQDARVLFTQLGLPIDFGTLVTGVKHQYKAHQDKNKNFLIYCSEKNKSNFHCLFSINKKLTDSIHQLENDSKQIHLLINDFNEAKRLYEVLNVPVLQHGSWYQKVIFDEANFVGISCITDSTTFAEYQCDFRIFKE